MVSACSKNSLNSESYSVHFASIKLFISFSSNEFLPIDTEPFNSFSGFDFLLLSIVSADESNLVELRFSFSLDCFEELRKNVSDV